MMRLPASGQGLGRGGIEAGHLGDVVAGAERAAAAAHHGDHRLGRGFETVERALEAGRHRGVERVERVGALEGDSRDRPV